jgi:hypothetical protein
VLLNIGAAEDEISGEIERHDADSAP